MRAYTSYSVTSPRDAVEEKLQRIEEYTAGWHFGEGSPMDRGAMERVRQLHEIGKGLGLSAGVFPHEDGNVSIMFKAGNHYLEVLCRSDETYSLTLEEGDGHPFTLVKEEENVSLSSALKEIFALVKQEFLWDFSDSSIETNTTMNWDDSPLYALSMQPSIEMEPPYARPNVELASSMLIVSGDASPPNPSANIYLSGMETPRLWEILSFTGQYQPYHLTLRSQERKERTLIHATEI